MHFSVRSFEFVGVLPIFSPSAAGTRAVICITMPNALIELLRGGSRRHDGFKTVPADELERDTGLQLSDTNNVADVDPPSPTPPDPGHSSLRTRLQTLPTASSQRT